MRARYMLWPSVRLSVCRSLCLSVGQRRSSIKPIKREIKQTSSQIAQGLELYDAIFKFWDCDHIFEAGETRQFESGVEVDIDEY